MTSILPRLSLQCLTKTYDIIHRIFGIDEVVLVEHVHRGVLHGMEEYQPQYSGLFVLETIAYCIH